MSAKLLQYCQTAGVLLLLACASIGCQSESEDEKYYKDDEQAVKEHMQEVEDEERANSLRQSPTASPTPSADPEAPVGE